MSNDITALMANIKAAAELIAHGYKRNWIVSHDDETCWVGANDDDGNLTPFIEVSIGDWSDNKTDNERLAAFIALAHPANVLALVEALEARDKQIAELEQRNNRLSEWGGKIEKLLKSTEESLIYSVDMVRELESRTVTVKLPKSHLADINAHDEDLMQNWCSVIRCSEMISALTTAGIQVIEGEGQ